MKFMRIVLIFIIFSFLVFTRIPSTCEETTLEGELTTGLSLASSNCKVVRGSIVCSNEPDGDDFTPYFYEQLLDLKVSGFFGPIGEVRSISEFYHPYAPFSGLTFQGFTAETLLGEIASVSGELIFAPNIIIYTSPDKRTDSFGGNFSGLAFRRYKSTVEFGLVGLTAAATLILDNWQDEPEDPPEIKPGLIFKVAGEMDNEVEVELETRFGAKGGVTCFGNCLGPLKLQQIAIQDDVGFEEFLFSADDIFFEEVGLRLSGKFSSDNGFNGLTISGTRTWDLDGYGITLSSNLFVSPTAFVPFTGTTVTWTANPFIFSVSFDESYKLENASQSLQFNPDLSEVGIEGLSFGSQALLDQQLNFNITVPTDPVEFTAGLRFENENGPYNFNSGILSARLDVSPFEFQAILAFRENSRIIKIETKFEF
ncbi:MAG: hypothetical protein V5A83_04445 [Candidatus Bipolaricaulota bacterium]